jgi:hypothetical protein
MDDIVKDSRIFAQVGISMGLVCANKQASFAALSATYFE